jgi:1,2-diacylglycerol 3-beta-galactosyltransferase
MNHKKRFLILTSDSGFGHRSAARSVQKALEAIAPEQVDILIINPILETDVPKLWQQMETGYDSRVKNSPKLYRFTYDISDSPQMSKLAGGALVFLLKKNIKQVIEIYKPDAILSTNQMYNTPVGAILKDKELKIPFFTVVTDLADVHAMWFTSGPDKYYVASEWVLRKGLESKVPPGKIGITGIPVDPDFSLIHEKREQLCEELGVARGYTNTLFVGSVRVENILENLIGLRDVKYPLQAIVITGGDHDLYEKLQGINFDFPVVLRDYVTNMPEWMAVADVLATKAGGLILSEGMAIGLPIMLIGYLPGQEEGNVRYLLAHQAGSLVTNPFELASVLNFWLENDCQRLKSVAANSKALGHPDSASIIAKELLAMCELSLEAD